MVTLNKEKRNIYQCSKHGLITKIRQTEEPGFQTLPSQSGHWTSGAFTVPVVATNTVASNTLLVEPSVSNNPLSLTPSHDLFLLPTEKIERLSKKPTRAQFVQIEA
jgi:hypothetical protein